MKPLVNRVASSGLITLNLEDYYPKQEIAAFDLKGFLFMEMILKEKDFRAALKEYDWSQYEGKILTVFCSVDAIIPKTNNVQRKGNQKRKKKKEKKNSKQIVESSTEFRLVVVF